MPNSNKTTTQKTDALDQAYLEQVAKDLRTRLLSIPLVKKAIHKKKLVLEKVDTKGWSVNLIWSATDKTGVEVWLDKYTNHEVRKLWFGIYTSDEKTAKGLARLWNEATGEEPALLRSAPNTPFKKSQFNRPIVEVYQDEGAFFFGFYEGRRPDYGTIEYKAVIENGLEFLRALLQHLEIAADGEFEAGEFTAHENRQQVISHVRRERNALLANLAKQRDGYICQICGFDSESVNGAYDAQIGRS